MYHFSASLDEEWDMDVVKSGFFHHLTVRLWLFQGFVFLAFLALAHNTIYLLHHSHSGSVFSILHLQLSWLFQSSVDCDRRPLKAGQEQVWIFSFKYHPRVLSYRFSVPRNTMHHSSIAKMRNIQGRQKVTCCVTIVRLTWESRNIIGLTRPDCTTLGISNPSRRLHWQQVF